MQESTIMDTELHTTIAQALEHERETRGVTWEEFAAQEGVEFSTLWRWKTGQTGKSAISRVLLPILLRHSRRNRAA
jgi:DNA-binding transcriptional regulator YiaG